MEKIRLSEKHLYLRVFLVILLLAVAAVSFTYALTSYLKEDTGWKVIQVSSAAKANVGDELPFSMSWAAVELLPQQNTRHLPFFTAMRR